MRERIKEGDIVNVFFEHRKGLDIMGAKVLYTPCATGDSWHLEKDGQSIYVGMFSRMDKWVE